MTGRLRPPSLARLDAAAGGLLRRQGRRSRRCWARCASTSRSSAATDPFLHPGRAARVLVGGRGRRLAGRAAPGRCRRVGPRARRRLRARPRDGAPSTPRRHRVYEDVTSFPAIRQDLAFWVAGGLTAAELVEVVRARRRRAAARREVFDVYARAGGEGSVSLALRLEFRAADRTLTDEEIAPRREKIVAAVREAGGRAAWLSVAVLGAAGYAGAIAAQLLYRHPCFELTHVTARAEAGAAARRRAPAHARAARARGLRRRPSATSTPRSSPTRTGPPRRSSPSCARAACASSTSRADFRLRDRGIYEDWYGEHKAPELFGTARLRAAGAARATRSRGADLVANPGCYPTAALLGAGAAGPRRADRATWSIDAKSGVSGAGRGATDARTSSPPTRTSRPTRSTATATRRRSSRSWRRSAATSRSRSCRTCCRSPRASWCPAT